MYSSFNLVDSRHRFQRQGRHSKRNKLPPANVGHSWTGTLSQPHSNVLEERPLRSVRVRHHQGQNSGGTERLVQTLH